MDLKSIPRFRNDPVLVLILGYITCGLYQIYWNIKAAEVLNAVSGRELISTPVSVISGCCNPVHLYYFYMAGQGLEDLANATGRPGQLKDKSMLLMLLGFFWLSPVAAMIVQGHLNELHDFQDKQP